MNMELTRRNFLGRAAVTLAALCSGDFSPARAESAETRSPGDVPSVLVDLTRCIGCRACVRACVGANILPETDESADVNLKHEQVLSSHLWTAVNAYTGNDLNGVPVARTVKKQCMHCLEPACASACPVAALYKTEDGPVVYRAERCIGCRYCMVACPFDIPKFQWNSGLTPVIGKCQFCFRNRLVKGESPACVSVCPTGALKFGLREDMLFEAHARLHARPEKYVNRVFGEKEAGGTSWLYISDVPFENAGFKKTCPDEPLPALTWAALSKIPAVVLTLGAVLSGLSFVLKRGEKS